MTNAILRYSKLLALLALAGLAACGDDDDDNGNNNPPQDRIVEVSGAASVLPQAAAVLGGSFDYGDLGDLEITLLSAAAQLTGTAAPLGDSPVPLTEVAATAATWTVADVDFDDEQLAIAIVALVDDPTNTLQTHPVITGILAEDDFPAAGVDTLSIGVADTDPGAPAFIVPDAFETALAADIGVAKATLVSGGYILGFAVTAAGAPVSGATITGFNDTTHDIFYPDFAGGTTPTTTGPTGLFVITGPATAAPISLTATAGSATYTGRAGVQPGITFVVPLT